MESVTLEMIANDDVGAIRRIPTNLSRAAKRTLYKAVFDLLASNATCTYDSVALAHAVSHGNEITTALSAANVSAARQLMAAQTAYGNSDEFLNIFPVTIVVPPELEETAWRIAYSPVANVSGQNATEPSYQRASASSASSPATTGRTPTTTGWWPTRWTSRPSRWASGRATRPPRCSCRTSRTSAACSPRTRPTTRSASSSASHILEHRGFVGGIVAWAPDLKGAPRREPPTRIAKTEESKSMATQAQGDHAGYQQDHGRIVPGHAAATATEHPDLHRAARAASRNVTFITGAAVTGDNTNRTNINLVKNTTEIGNFDTVATTGDITAKTPVTLLSTTTSLAAGDDLYIELEKVGSGVLLPALLVTVVVDFGA